MKTGITKENFTTRLRMKRVSYVTGWKLIQQNEEFRNCLFLQYQEEYRQPTTSPQNRQFSTLPQYHQLTSLPLYRQLDSITDHIIDFKKRPLTSGEYNPAGYGEAFAKTLIRKLEGISCPGLGTAILKDFMNDEENHIIENRERKHSQTYNQAFTDYRKIKMYADDLIDDYLKTAQPQPKPEPLDIDREFQFENNFDSVDSAEVYEYFHTKLVEKKRLSEKDLRKFLKAAFEDKEPPQQKFRLLDVTKKDARTVFHTYYKNIATDTHGKAWIYAGLLGNYFEGYKTDNVYSNFSKNY